MRARPTRDPTVSQITRVSYIAAIRAPDCNTIWPRPGDWTAIPCQAETDVGTVIHGYLGDIGNMRTEN